MECSEEISSRCAKVFEGINKTERCVDRSWEHCYRIFGTCDQSEAGIDLASLHLGFYLASWGMYRGSAAIRQFDYRIHIPMVGTLLKQEYLPLRAATPEFLLNNSELFWRLVEEMRGNIYPPIVTMTATLVTKILMGTLGCAPAYDRFFKAGLLERSLRASFSRDDFNSLLLSSNRCVNQFRIAKQIMGDYPFMRVIDMYFHDLGREVEISSA